MDEFGGVEGCVTLEDLLEEIVGEIRDEKDKVQQVFQSEGNDAILTNGDIEIDKINEIFKTNIPEGDDYSRLNGLLHEKYNQFLSSSTVCHHFKPRPILCCSHQPTSTITHHKQSLTVVTNQFLSSSTEDIITHHLNTSRTTICCSHPPTSTITHHKQLVPT